MIMTDEKMLEAVLEKLEFKGEPRGERKGITFWVTPEEHAIYHKLQEKSNRSFGKSFESLLRRVIAKKAV